jgi:hypothetical protein
MPELVDCKDWIEDILNQPVPVDFVEVVFGKEVEQLESRVVDRQSEDRERQHQDAPIGEDRHELSLKLFPNGIQG